MATQGMKLSKATESEIDSIYDIINDFETLSERLESNYYDNIDKTGFDSISIESKDHDDVLEYVLKLIVRSKIRKLLFNLSTLLENCADPECDTLEFNKDIKRGLELLELEKQDKLLISL